MSFEQILTMIVYFIMAFLSCIGGYVGIVFRPPSQQTRGLGLVFVECWAIVPDAAPTLKQHWAGVFCFQGYTTYHNHFAAFSRLNRLYRCTFMSLYFIIDFPLFNICQLILLDACHLTILTTFQTQHKK